MIADLKREGQAFILAKGGAGGRGNAFFKSSTNRAPRKSQPGEAGQEMWVWLRLKLIADAGLLGLPNADWSNHLRRSAYLERFQSKQNRCGQIVHKAG